MNWHKAKTILIIYFIITNFALLVYLIYGNYITQGTKTRVAEQVIELLNEKNIYIDKELLYKNNFINEMRYVYVSNAIKNHESFAAEVLGEENIIAEENCFKTDRAYVCFEGDSFEIRTYNLPIAEYQVNKNNAQKYAKEYLESIGLEIKEYEVTVSNTENGYNVVFSEYIDDYEIFGTKVNVEMQNDGIYSVFGSWYNVKSKSDKSNIKDISGILIEYMNIKMNKGLSDSITDIQLGYYTFESNDFHESLLLTPVWKITNGKNENEYIDARESN